jgi:glucose-6-phosphate isomerase
MADDARLAEIVRGIWSRDPTTWTAATAHHPSIRNRLGWLDAPATMRHRAGELKEFAREARQAGFTHALLLGMGGSSLAPDVLRLTFGVKPGFLDLAVLDSTDPYIVLQFQRSLPAQHTLYVVSTKSGTTTETLAFLRFFYDHTRRAAGDRAGRQFIAITDPGTPLEQTARDLGFRRTFLNPPDIGGRYSALSYFGLVAAALLGVDLDTLLDRAEAAMRDCGTDVPLEHHPGARLGAALARHAATGRDKVTLVCPEPFGSFGYWVEQLLAESTGKDGSGLVPVEGEPLGPPGVYGQDRVFVVVGDPQRVVTPADGKRALEALEAAGHPVIHLPAREPADLGYQFYVWEFATAVAGACMRLNPFDEPNVQESKDNTTRVLAEFQATGHLPAVPEIVAGNGPAQPLHDLLRRVQPGDYVALLAYVPRTAVAERELTGWRTALRDHLKVATTLGYGPRYLHSTGQLHKGGPDNGVFVQLVSDDPEDAPIPGLPYTFATLKQAQAIGDYQALAGRGRRIVRIRLRGDLEPAIRGLAVETVPLFPWWEAGHQRPRGP